MIPLTVQYRAFSAITVNDTLLRVAITSKGWKRKKLHLLLLLIFLSSKEATDPAVCVSAMSVSSCSQPSSEQICHLPILLFVFLLFLSTKLCVLYHHHQSTCQLFCCCSIFAQTLPCLVCSLSIYLSLIFLHHVLLMSFSPVVGHF